MTLKQRKITKTAVTETNLLVGCCKKEQRKDDTIKPTAQLEILSAYWISFLPQKVKFQSYCNAGYCSHRLSWSLERPCWGSWPSTDFCLDSGCCPSRALGRPPHFMSIAFACSSVTFHEEWYCLNLEWCCYLPLLPGNVVWSKVDTQRGQTLVLTIKWKLWWGKLHHGVSCLLTVTTLSA